MARLDNSRSCVEEERLVRVVATQKQHITELRVQLREALEAQQQQQLKLVQQSPARRSVRRLLEQAAADNTNLAKRVEELRAERNALTVTKAALTAQVSELIRLAADDRRREEQYRLLLHQLHQLCRLMHQPHLQEPEEQMVAVVAHIKQLYRERQELSEKLDAAMRSSSSSYNGTSTAKQPRPAALSTPQDTGCMPAGHPGSPTGLKLDQRATSHLIWTSNQQQQQQQRQQAGCTVTAAAALDQAQGGGGAAAGPAAAAAAAACDAGVSCSDAASASYNTVQSSSLLDLDYISPLRGVTNNNSSSISGLGRKIIRDDTPCSRAPGPFAADSSAAAGTPAGTAACAAGADAGTPLSAQSLSAFSTHSQGAMPSPRMRKALQALSPLRRCGLPRSGSHTSVAAAAASSGCSSAGSSTSSTSRTAAGALTDLPTPRLGADQQHLMTPAGTQTAALAAGGRQQVLPPGTACSRPTPRGSPLSVGACGFGSSVSVAAGSSKQGSVGLSLQPEFRLTAAADHDGIWPSPAAARGSSALGLATAGSAVSSHRLWLLDAAAEEAGGRDGADVVGDNAELLCGFSPRALTDTYFLQGALEDSCGEQGAAVESGQQDDAAGQHCAQGSTRSGRGVVSRLLWLGVSLAVAAAGGAAAWRHKQAEVMQLVSLLQGGAAAVGGRARAGAAGGVHLLQRHASRRRSQAARQALASGATDDCQPHEQG